MNDHSPHNPVPTPDLDPADPKTPAPPKDIHKEAGSEASRRTRRRLLTLGEVLAVAGLIIAGLTLWNNIAMRQGQEADRKAEEAQARQAAAATAHQEALVTLQGAPVQGGKTLKLSDVAGHRIQNIQLRFPPALGLPPHGSVLDLKIESQWLAKRMLGLTDGGPDKIAGEVPVLITSSYWDGDKPVTDSAIYGLVFETHGGFMSGRTMRLRGVVLLDRVKSGTTAKALNPLWEAERKRIENLKTQ